MTKIGPHELLVLISGPGAAVFVLLIVLYGLYKLVVVHGIPAAEAITKRHLDQIDKMLDDHREDSAAMLKTLKGIEKSLVVLGDKKGSP
jgi:hypothetical protein